jgi:hypothetical protein
LKESLLKNKNLKYISFNWFNIFDDIDILDDEFQLVYKLLKLTENDIDLSFSNNIYISSPFISLKLNYLKCFFDEIDHIFLNFQFFDIFIFYEKIE